MLLPLDPPLARGTVLRGEVYQKIKVWKFLMLLPRSTVPRLGGGQRGWRGQVLEMLRGYAMPTLKFRHCEPVSGVAIPEL